MTTEVIRSGRTSHGSPEHLVEQKTEISETGAVSEILHEVKSAPGLLAERTVKVTTLEDGSVEEQVQEDSTAQETKSVTKRSMVIRDEDSVLGKECKLVTKLIFLPHTLVL